MAGDSWVRPALDDLKAQGRWRTLDARVVQARDGRTVTVAGRELLCFAGNDYLGLSAHPAVMQASSQATLALGTGSGASRHISGNLDLHRALETQLADWFRAPATLLFGSGYLANTGILRALVGTGDHVFSDQLNHASLVDGCRGTRARVHIYDHRDVQHLKSLLELHRHQGGRRLVVTDAVFSMDGTVAPLEQICAVAHTHDAMVLLDEAHAVGVLGGGRGLACMLGLEDQVTVRMGTLGKALASYGAFAAGTPDVVALLENVARTLIYSTALPPGTVAAALAALQQMQHGPYVDRLHHLCRLAMTQLSTHRLEHLLPSSLRGLSSLPTPIVPLVLHDNQRALDAAAALAEDGFLTVGIRPPTVPQGSARLRITLNAAHTDADVVALVAAVCRHTSTHCRAHPQNGIAP